ncbi:MAG: cyclic nucleotide-binding domain-containing protein [Spirochaetales bacterium]|jgi:CRP/FNR family cyclic AMP-dependent transcriptional regulator|nr:cyclic nucleotide-binding domain-containing protein [Spirochaetales bacterium]
MGKSKVDDTFLYSHSLFGGLTSEEIDFIRDSFHEEIFNKNDVILHQGEPNSKIFFIIEGGVVICKHPTFSQDSKEAACERIISRLSVGDTFGEMELIDIQPCAASVIADCPTRILTFTNYDLYQISKTHCRTYAMIIMNLAREISRRLRKTDEDLAYLLYTKNGENSRN